MSTNTSKKRLYRDAVIGGRTLNRFCLLVGRAECVERLSLRAPMWAMRVRSFAGVIDWACQVGAPKAAEIPWAQLAAYSLRSLIQALI